MKKGEQGKKVPLGVCAKCGQFKSLGTISHKWNGEYTPRPGRCFTCDPEKEDRR